MSTHKLIEKLHSNAVSPSIIAEKTREFWESWWTLRPAHPFRIYTTIFAAGYHVGSVQGLVVGYIFSKYTEYLGRGFSGRRLTTPFWGRVAGISLGFGALTSSISTYITSANLGKYVETTQEKSQMAEALAHNWETQKLQIFSLLGATVMLPWKQPFGSRLRAGLMGSALGAFAWGVQWAYFNGLSGYTAGPMIHGSYWAKKTKSDERQTIREARRTERAQLRSQPKEQEESAKD